MPLSLDGVPVSVELARVRNYLSGLPGVSEAHDLHVWAMSTSETALTVHVVMPDGHPWDEFLVRVTNILPHDFDIEHPTIQVETGHQPCALSVHVA